MKRSHLILSVLAVLALAPSGHAAPASASACRDLFKGPAAFAEGRVGHGGRLAFARLLEQAGVADSAYAVQWKLKENSNPGPYPTSGEFIVSAVPAGKVSDWIRSAGKSTIGFAVEGLPGGGGFHSATLRVGHRLYEYSDIQNGYGYRDLSISRMYGPHTESTFFVTDAEMKEIVKFIDARGAEEILAKEDIKNGPDSGFSIAPDFDYTKNTLTEESCAGACTSFVNPLWLKHYEGAQILRRMAERLGVESNPAAKAMVWRQARKSNIMAITQLGVETLALGNFIETNKWGQLKGMPVYSLIPDPVGGENNQVISRRIPLAQWLREN